MYSNINSGVLKPKLVKFSPFSGKRHLKYPLFESQSLVAFFLIFFKYGTSKEIPGLCTLPRATNHLSFQTWQTKKKLLLRVECVFFLTKQVDASCHYPFQNPRTLLLPHISISRPDLVGSLLTCGNIHIFKCRA